MKDAVSERCIDSLGGGRFDVADQPVHSDAVDDQGHFERRRGDYGCTVDAQSIWLVALRDPV
jgi:hypothetical protein